MQLVAQHAQGEELFHRLGWEARPVRPVAQQEFVEILFDFGVPPQQGQAKPTGSGYAA